MDVSKDRYCRRCPKLGGPVAFSYCRSSGASGLPCHKIMDCWWEVFDIHAFLKLNYAPEQLKAFARRSIPEPKISSLIDLIAKARRSSGTDDV